MLSRKRGRVDADTSAAQSTHTSFEDLIAGRKRKSELSDGSKLMLEDAVFQLISHHQDTDKLLKEATESSNEFGGKKEKGQVQDVISGVESVTTESCYEALKEQSIRTGCQLPVLAARTFAEKILQILASESSPGQLLLAPQQRVQTENILRAMKTFMEEQNFHRSHFAELITKQGKIPVEVIWMLHTEYIMPLDTYLTRNMSRPDVMKDFAKDLTELCFCTDEMGSLRKQITDDIVGKMIGAAYSERAKEEDSSARNLRKVALATVSAMTKNFISHGLEGKEGGHNINLFSLVQNSKILDPQAIKKYSTVQLSTIMGLNPEFKVSQALMTQNKWSFARTSTHITEAYKQLLMVFEPAEAIKLVTSVLERQEVNWQTVLSLISSILVSMQGAPQILKDVIDDLLKKAFDSLELDSLITGFLIARQACLEGPHSFPSYSDWFQSCFGDSSSSPAGSKKTFSFLMKFLTDIVPYETGPCLKAHILRPPFIPPKCRPLYSDYTLLAKTRLADLKEPVTDTGLYDDTASGTTIADKSQVQSQTEKDVEKALAAYVKTGKVPTSIMEASIFRKPYYVGRFLPSLLKPRPLPDIPDDRMKLIGALLKSEKIPTQLYNTYEKRCQKEAANLLDGVPFDEDSMDDMLLPPGEQLQHALDHLATIVIGNNHAEKAGTRSLSQVSIISEKLHGLLGTEPGAAPLTKPLMVDIVAPSIDKVHLQVVDQLMNSICKTVTAVLSTGRYDMVWLAQVMAMLSQHTQLIPAIIFRLWHLLTKQGPSLELGHISALAAMLVHISSQPSTAWQHVVVKLTTGQEAEKENLVELLCKCIPYSTKEWMQFYLGFSTAYLQHSFSGFEQFSLHHLSTPGAFLPPTLLKMFSYMVPRLVPDTRYPDIAPDEEIMEEEEGEDGVKVMARSIYRSDKLQEVIKDIKLTLDAWLDLEWYMVPHRDVLPELERHEFHTWALFDHFLQLSTEQGGCGGSYRQAASALYRRLMKPESSSPQEAAQPNHCMSVHSEGKHEGNSRSQFINLLQTITAYFGLEKPGALTSHSWLHARFYIDCEKSVSNPDSDDALETYLVNFFSLATSLPPYLLYGDSLTAKLTKESMEHLVRFINQIMRHSFTEGSHLSYSNTDYLLKGLLFLSANSEAKSLVDIFLERSRVLRYSVMIHWSKLHSSLQHVHQAANMYKYFQEVFQWSESVLSVQMVKPPVIDCHDTCLRSAALYGQIKTLKSSVSAKTVSKLMEYGYYNVVNTLLSWIIGDVASKMIQHKMSDREPLVGQALLLLAAHTVAVEYILDEEHGLYGMVFSQLTRKMVPAAFLRIVLCAEEEVLKELLEHPSFIDVTMDSFTTVSQRHLEDSETNYHSLGLKFILTCGDLTKRLISMTSEDCLRQICEHTLQRLDSDIRRHLKAILSSF